MNLYPENYDVTIGVAFTDLNGAAVTPTAVTAILYDGDDQLVNDFGAIAFTPGDTSVDILVPAAFNVLGVGEITAARILRVTLVTAAGEIRRASSYIIEGEFRLVVMQNSFATIEAAEIIARDMPNLAGWNSADGDQRAAALINAYHRLTRISMRFRIEKTPITHVYDGFNQPSYHWTRDLIHGTRVPEIIVLAQAWSGLTIEEFMEFPSAFRKAVRMAQVAEANEILENDVTARRHRQGIISETVGESSIMLRGGRLSLGIGTTALEYLAGLVFYQFKIVRG